MALAAFHALTQDLFDESMARRATAYLAVFPFGYAFSMVYPESIVLALIALAALAARRRHWGLAAVCAAAAALARPEGLFVALPLAVLAWQQRETLSPRARGVALGAVLAPAAAIGSFSLYLGSVLGLVAGATRMGPCLLAARRLECGGGARPRLRARRLGDP